MASFEHNPPLPPRPPPGAFVQTIRMSDEGKPIGIAHWSVNLDIAGGAFQLLDLAIDPAHARRGFGGQLLGEVIRQARAFFRAQNVPLRRMWITVEQKTQVVARAFLTGHGFHHVATIPNLLKGQDVLVYTKSFD